MEIKGIMTMIVTLAVGIILTVGVLVPIIANGSGSGSGYTNIGDYYYRTPVDGEQHTIVITKDGTNAVITFDDEPFKTIAMGNEGWVLPIFFNNDDVMQWAGVIHYELYLDYDDPTQFDNDPMLSIGGSEISTSKTVTINGNQATIGGGGSYDIDLYIAPTGDYVYSDEPIVADDSTFYLIDGVFTRSVKTDSADGIDKNISYMAKNSGLTFPTLYKIAGDMDIYGASYGFLETESATVTSANTTDQNGAVKINGVDITVTWEDNSTEDITFTHLVVPVNVGSGGGSGGISPTLSSIIWVIPLIMIVGMIIMTVGYFINKK